MARKSRYTWEKGDITVTPPKKKKAKKKAKKK